MNMTDIKVDGSMIKSIEMGGQQFTCDEVYMTAVQQLSNKLDKFVIIALAGICLYVMFKSIIAGTLVYLFRYLNQDNPQPDEKYYPQIKQILFYIELMIALCAFSALVFYLMQNGMYPEWLNW